MFFVSILSFGALKRVEVKKLIIVIMAFLILRASVGCAKPEQVDIYRIGDGKVLSSFESIQNIFPT